MKVCAVVNRAANWNSPLYRKAVLLVLCLPALALPSLAANDCPWLNEATAGGLLGGDALGAFTKAAVGRPAACLFTSDTQSSLRTLRITVETVSSPHSLVVAEKKSCGADGTPLHAVGNEAFACPTYDHKGMFGQRAVGRVRNMFFTITIATSLRADPVLTHDALSEKIRTAAEQVANNLF